MGKQRAMSIAGDRIAFDQPIGLAGIFLTSGCGGVAGPSSTEIRGAQDRLG